MSSRPEVAEATGVETTRLGQIVVGPDLSISSHPEIFVVGDLASYAHQTGTPVRGTADVAIAEGKYIGKAIRRRLMGKPAKQFKFFDLGTLAVTNLRFGRFSGRLAWWTWFFSISSSSSTSRTV